MDEGDSGLESRKDQIKKRRREQYKKAKEKYQNSDYGKAMKIKQKQMRQSAYQQAKQRHREATDGDSAKSASDKSLDLWREIKPGSTIAGPKLRLVVNNSGSSSEK